MMTTLITQRPGGTMYGPPPPATPPHGAPTPPKGRRTQAWIIASAAALIAAIAAAGIVLTSSDEPSSNTAATSAASSEPAIIKTTAPTISPECRAWIEAELLDSSEQIDATAGYDVCGDLSGDELDRAIDEVTNDVIRQGATPAEGPDEYGDGDYQVGRDIPPGTYESAGASGDGIGLCAITTEPTGSKLPQVKSADVSERIIITLDKGDGVATVKGCEPLTLRK